MTSKKLKHHYVPTPPRRHWPAHPMPWKAAPWHQKQEDLSTLPPGVQQKADPRMGEARKKAVESVSWFLLEHFDAHARPQPDAVRKILGNSNSSGSRDLGYKTNLLVASNFCYVLKTYETLKGSNNEL
jgi:hypothetical protein